MGSLPGVIRTRVGYAGGSMKDPTYLNLADHTETVQVDFDPSQLTYEALVRAFFAAHDATGSSSGRQYMSVIFVGDAEQEGVARSVLQQVQARSEKAIKTVILPLTAFYPAEDYHQKYALQRDSVLFAEFQAMYPVMRDLVDSPAAARVNAYLYGYGTSEQLEAEIDRLGISAAAKAHLLRTAPAGACPIDQPVSEGSASTP